MAFRRCLVGLQLPVVRQCGRRVFQQSTRRLSFPERSLQHVQRLFHNDSFVTDHRTSNRYGLSQKFLSLENSFGLKTASRQVHIDSFPIPRQVTRSQKDIQGYLFNKRFKSDTTNAKESTGTEEQKLSVFQRFKIAYKEHGKILVGVHLVTSAVWFGSFYYAASIGVDIIPILERLGFSEKIIHPFRSSSLGNVALAYLMYKVATPARYTVTLGGTNFMIKYLRSRGKMPPQQEPLKQLGKDSRKAISSRMKKRQKKVKARAKTIQKRVNNQFKTIRKRGRSRLKLTTSKLMSRIRRRKKKEET